MLSQGSWPSATPKFVTGYNVQLQRLLQTVSNIVQQYKLCLYGSTATSIYALEAVVPSIYIRPRLECRQCSYRGFGMTGTTIGWNTVGLDDRNSNGREQRGFG